MTKWSNKEREEMGISHYKIIVLQRRRIILFRDRQLINKRVYDED